MHRGSCCSRGPFLSCQAWRAVLCQDYRRIVLSGHGLSNQWAAPACGLRCGAGMDNCFATTSSYLINGQRERQLRHLCTKKRSYFAQKTHLFRTVNAPLGSCCGFWVLISYWRHQSYGTSRKPSSPPLGVDSNRKLRRKDCLLAPQSDPGLIRANDRI